MAPSAPTTCCRGSASTRYSTSRLVSRPWYAPYSTMFPINTYKSVYGAKSPLGSFSISDVLFQMYYCSIDFLPKKHRSCNCAPRSTKDSEGRTCRTRKAADLRTSLSHSRRSVTSLRLCHLRTDWSNQMLGSPQSPRTRRYTVVHRSVLVTFLSRSCHALGTCLPERAWSGNAIRPGGRQPSSERYPRDVAGARRLSGDTSVSGGECPFSALAYPGRGGLASPHPLRYASARAQRGAQCLPAGEHASYHEL